MLCAAMNYQDNPARARFEDCRNLRSLAKKFRLDAFVKPHLILASPTISRTKDPETGAVSTSINGGPYIDTAGFAYKFKPKGMQAEKTYPSGKASLLTWTSKMSCPSFSLPAGHPDFLGTCAAQSRKDVEKAGFYRTPELGHPWDLREMPDGESFVCDLCYAAKGNYGYPSTNITQMKKVLWVKKTLKAPGDLNFVNQMSRAIGFLFEPDVAELLESKGISNQFFRIHDAGDFFSKEYYDAWVEICRRLPTVQFWAPTRLWVFPNYLRWFLENPPPENLALRPSTLFTSAPPPKIAGLAAGTASIKVPPEKKARKPRVAANPSKEELLAAMPKNLWDCPAYMYDEASCEGAKCRVCWKAKGTPVNYKTH